jgi:hypothetical protein
LTDESVYLAIGAIYRDEAPYLREWIEFHRLVGVERFFLYDNMSEDDHVEMLAPYLDAGTVTLRRWDLFPGQNQSYDHCLEAHRDDARWIAFVDLDEFLFSPTGRPLPEILREFEPWPGVGANWATFGDSGHLTKPPGLVIENYLHRSDDYRRNCPIKSIVDPKRTLRCGGNPHFFLYEDSALAVDENKQPITAQDHTEAISFDLLRVNHYVTKSRAERERKIARPVAFDGRIKNAERIRIRDRELNEVRDETILLYVPALREALSIPA